MQNRRLFLKSTPFLAAGLTPRYREPGHRAEGGKAGVRRSRRVIWNNDGDDLAIVAYHGQEGDETNTPNYPYPPRYSSVEEFLGKRMKGKLDGTQVDSIFYCGFCAEPNWDFPSRNLESLGPDPLRHVVDFAHRSGMEFTYSLRMNDIHHAVHTGVHRWSPFRRKNLHLLQGDVKREWFERRVVPWARGLTGLFPNYEHPLAEAFRAGGHLLAVRTGARPSDYRSWAAYDYAQAEVRAYMLTVIEGACQRYDLDGIELDWGRTPPFFKAGEERRNAPVMSDFIRQIRQKLDALSTKRGRPILLATRVPDSPVQAMNMGLDVETWMGERWVDLVVAGFGGAPFSFPLAEWLRLAHPQEIPVYGCIENDNLFGFRKEAIRAAAYRYWTEGADGIYLYNHFYDMEKTNPTPGWPGVVRPGDTLNDIGDPKRLERLAKLYRIDIYANPQLPLNFTTQSGATKARLRLQIADAAEKAARCTMLTKWEAGTDLGRIRWRLNGHPLSYLKPFSFDPGGDAWDEYDAKPLRKGVNEFEVTVQPAAGAERAAQVVLREVRISVRYS